MLVAILLFLRWESSHRADDDSYYLYENWLIIIII